MLINYHLYLNMIYYTNKQLVLYTAKSTDDLFLSSQLILSDVDAIPDPTSNAVTGSNFYDRKEQMIHVLVRGSDHLDIKTNKLVIVTFGVPTMTIDEFFGPKIVANLAAFLDIPPERIKIANAVSASGRKKRDTVTQVGTYT